MALTLALFVVFCPAAHWKEAFEIWRMTALLFPWGNYAPGFWGGQCYAIPTWPAGTHLLGDQNWFRRMTFSTNEVSHCPVCLRRALAKNLGSSHWWESSFLLSSECFMNKLSVREKDRERRRERAGKRERGRREEEELGLYSQSFGWG